MLEPLQVVSNEFKSMVSYDTIAHHTYTVDEEGTSSFRECAEPVLSWCSCLSEATGMDRGEWTKAMDVYSFEPSIYEVWQEATVTVLFLFMLCVCLLFVLCTCLFACLPQDLSIGLSYLCLCVCFVYYLACTQHWHGRWIVLIQGTGYILVLEDTPFLLIVGGQGTCVTSR